MKTQPEIANGIDARIVLVRGHKAILDRDLAELY
ncbi:MAG: ORF6N domain-containing protein, partial [Betaproteobacteria bacterium]